ncbi:MAG: NAD(P)H-dependent oxidoreductase subunit E [Deltaproteobacteria bacterium]|nr:NAD(P)H-dependent oxidoreductase subunit E [Deltaproteobacteria bacterium]
MPDLHSLSEILLSRPNKPVELLALMQLIQAKYRYLPEEALRELASYLKLPLSRVFAVAGFYKALSLTPKGEKLVKVCCGTACHLKGARQIQGALEEKLKIKLGETGADGKLSLESVNCVGACALAPVVMIDETVFGKTTPKNIGELPLLT